MRMCLSTWYICDCQYQGLCCRARIVEQHTTHSSLCWCLWCCSPYHDPCSTLHECQYTFTYISGERKQNFRPRLLNWIINWADMERARLAFSTVRGAVFNFSRCAQYTHTVSCSLFSAFAVCSWRCISQKLWFPAWKKLCQAPLSLPSRMKVSFRQQAKHLATCMQFIEFNILPHDNCQLLLEAGVKHFTNLLLMVASKENFYKEKNPSLTKKI